MSESRKMIFRQTAVVLLGQVVCVAAMCGIYALLEEFDMRVLLGGAVGASLAVLNFFFMAVGAVMAADQAEAGEEKKGKGTIHLSYGLRMVVLALVLFACARSGLFNLLALVLPLAFVRPTLSLYAFFGKSGDGKK